MTATHQNANARERLRAATAERHAQVDACFPQGVRTLRSYHAYLTGMQALLQTLANADAALAAHYAPQLDALGADTQALRIPALSTLAAWPIGMDDWARLGVRYVLEGAAMGARSLLIDARSLGMTPTHGARFLAYHAERGRTHWPQLLRMLADADASGGGFEAMSHAACATFDLATACFLQAGASKGEIDDSATAR